MALENLLEIHNGRIFRVSKRSGVSPFDHRPKIEDFLPSSEEKLRAAAGGPALISVLHNAPVLICFMHRGLYPSIAICLALQVPEVTKIEAINGTRRLRVWQDPLPMPNCLLPGSEFHAGISGLERPAGEDRKIQRGLCSRLVDIAERVTA